MKLKKLFLMFLIQPIQGTGRPGKLTLRPSDLATRLKIFPKQMLQRLPIALAEVKVDSTSENLLNSSIFEIMKS